MPRLSANTSELEAEIDQLCYNLYGLTDEEIAAVEGGQSPVLPVCARDAVYEGVRELVENRKQRARSAG